MVAVNQDGLLATEEWNGLPYIPGDQVLLFLAALVLTILGELAVAALFFKIRK